MDIDYYDVESDSDEDLDTQMKELEQLTAVLEADEHSSNVISRYSASPGSDRNFTNKLEQYSKIETALALNKLTEDKLLRLENILVDKLIECRRKLAEFQNSNRLYDRTERTEIFRYKQCGKPYFRDKCGFQPSDNADTILMAKLGMYDFSLIASVPGWTVKDKSEFISLVLKMSRDIKIGELNSKIAQLNRDARLKDAKVESEIEAVREKIKNISKKSLREVALPIDQEYDWDTIANQFTQRHSAQEYRALWKLFLHPSIRKDSWTKHEHMKLQRIAEIHKLTNWQQIAQELNTGRTEYQCFVYFRTNMCNTFTNQKWTKEEEEYLKRLIEYYREDDYIPWGKVASSMENRTKMQIYNKYMRLVEIRKGRFLPEEDAVILNCVEKYGTDFKKVNNYLAGRSAAQIRNRFNVLKKTRISIVWTLEEDKKLIQMMANQDSSTNFASISKFLPGKDRVHIRARYVTLVKWMQRNPNVDIFHAPRRGARRLCHGQAADNLNKAVESLKDRMLTEVQHKKSKRITKDSTEQEIDDALVAFMITEAIKNPKKHQDDSEVLLCDNTVVTAGNLNATNLQKSLILLKAKLNQTNFRFSSISDKYPELYEREREVCLVKVKSYSKKSLINTIRINKPPDVWGNHVLGSTEYFLPPHLATITGCRALIAHASTKELSKINLLAMKHKNVIFKEQLYCLMERFNLLFLWPMLLSNEIPVGESPKKKSFVVCPKSAISLLNMNRPRNIRNCLLFEDSEEDGGNSRECERDKDAQENGINEEHGL